MWYRNSGGVVAPLAQDDKACSESPMDHTSFQKTVDHPENWNPGMKSPDCEDLKSLVTTHHPATVPDTSSMLQSHTTQPLYNSTDINNGTNVTPLFWDPSFNVPDPLLDFDWLFESIPSHFNPANESLEDISPSRTGISDVSPPSLPRNNQSPLDTDSSSFAPWGIAQARLLEALSTVPEALLSSSFFSPSNLSHFYDLYFHNYHPHFPILHRPTLDPATAPALLIAAIVTLGSTLSKEESHFQISTQIHDSLRYIIFTVLLTFFTLDLMPYKKLIEYRLQNLNHLHHYGVCRHFC